MSAESKLSELEEKKMELDRVADAKRKQEARFTEYKEKKKTAVATARKEEKAAGKEKLTEKRASLISRRSSVHSRIYLPRSSLLSCAGR